MTTSTTTNGAAATAANNGANGAPAAGRDHVVIFPFMAKGHTLPLLHFATALSVHHKSLSRHPTHHPGQPRVRRQPPSVVGAPRRAPLPVAAAPAGRRRVHRRPPIHVPVPDVPACYGAPTGALRPVPHVAPVPAPLALVSDFFLGFTHRVATATGVRRVVFHGMSCFSMAICKALITRPPAMATIDLRAPFHVHGMPEHVAITADEIPDVVVKFADFEDTVTRFFIDEVGFLDVLSWGVLVNSVAALDEDYVASLESFYLQPGARAWVSGPLFLAAGDMSELEKEEDPEGCLAWQDERAGQPGSVVYVSFGTQTHISDAQLDEIADGLVQSGHPFLWVVRSDTWSPPVDVGPHGKIVRRWVPQRSILAHKAVGGFVSHCGWNSVMESLAAGKPILAWPMIAEQGLNARHVADIVGAGIKVDKKPRGTAAVDVIGRAEVEEKVRKLMDADSDAGKKIRARATWAQQAAKSAVGEGGASRVALEKLVDELQRTYRGIVE